MDDEDIGDVSGFAPPQHLAKVLQGIKQNKLPKPYIMNLIAMLGFEDIEDSFEEFTIDDPAEQSVYRTFNGLYRAVAEGKPYSVPEGFPIVYGFEFSGNHYILFVKDKSIIPCIDFDW